ncbi:hypothetical protein [Bradyrhizobium betae]|uniref:Uncharacterized protein n=1 Tax=Bradyrhizobium betae TaxID=244734 RepID=A0A5P6NYP6_9BRAD|nr:hypothetical protein [Bradyrhizobium betae]MCS3725457.1 hypothetical protein [Bradyrhizobium betae]QFI71249.1 hypothetical protein F8237_01985 [Bradyrhizobium betae]
MSAAADTTSSKPAPSQNPFKAASAALIARLLALPVPEAIGEVSDHLRDAANIFDQWLYAVGSGVADRVATDVDMRPFQGAFLGAVDGNATYEAECAVETASRRRSFARRA